MDGERGRLVANTESNGRFHSDWLSMMYPRLKLARNLLADDGVVAISIDENEISNLHSLGSQVFGEASFLFQIAVLSNPKGRSHDRYVARCHDYIVGYSRMPLPKGAINISKTDEEIAANFRLRDSRGAYRELELRNTHREFGRHNRPNLYYAFHVMNDGSVTLDPRAGAVEVLPVWDDGYEGCWTWSPAKSESQINELVGKKVAGKWKVYRKAYAFGEDDEATKQVKSIWTDKEFHTEKGQADFSSLFESRDKLFQAPKPVELIRRVLQMGSGPDSIVLDFFAGSGTTAHAVFKQNAVDGGRRRFILVQLPEKVDPESAAYQEGFRTIADIAKERVRRAGTAIVEVAPSSSAEVDIGFRVVKVDTSNRADVLRAPDDLRPDQLALQADNVKPDRTAEDLLFEVLINFGLELTMPISVERIAGHEAFVVDDGALVACFGAEVSVGLVRAIGEREPLRAVFRDSGFASDADRINAEQVLAEVSPSTDVKVI